ncbi:hypothetical protein [Sphingomonas sp. PP-CC-1A-547]
MPLGGYCASCPLKQ